MEIWEQGAVAETVSGKMVQTERAEYGSNQLVIKAYIKMFVMANGFVCVCVWLPTRTA